MLHSIYLEVGSRSCDRVLVQQVGITIISVGFALAKLAIASNTS